MYYNLNIPVVNSILRFALCVVRRNKSCLWRLAFVSSCAMHRIAFCVMRCASCVVRLNAGRMTHNA
jgi:hypothetical protein